MKPHYLLTICLSALLFTSCISKKKLLAEQDKYAKLNTYYMQVQDDLKKCRDAEAEAQRRKALLETEITGLNKQIDFLKENNNTVLNQLKDLSVITGSQAESIKKSLDNIGAKDAYIQGLQSALARKDSLNMVLVMNLKGALADVNDKDVEIKVEKGVVFISISDKMLFKSGKSEVTDQAMTVLGKVAQVLNSKPEIEFLVEGHTDNVGEDAANMDLSKRRSASVKNYLVKKGVSADRITTDGFGETRPVASNDNEEGRHKNRRVEMTIIPE